jgi:hypothetical protein
MIMMILYPSFYLLSRIGVIYIQLNEFRYAINSGSKGADTMHQLSTDTKGISIILSRNRMIDLNTEGGEG